MKRIFLKSILATTILGMTTVPVFAAFGHSPYRILPKSSAAAYHAQLFGGARLHYAQSTSEDGGSEEEGDYGGSDMEDSNESDQRFAEMRDASSGRGVAKMIDNGEEFCRLLDSANMIDCLAEAYQSIARGLSDEGDEGVVKRALEDAAGQLDRIVRANLDRSVNLTRPTVKTRKVNRTASRPLRAIKKANIPAAHRQAETVVAELSTVLLRSAGNSSKKKAYYARIAQAVDSNKVLLRS